MTTNEKIGEICTTSINMVGESLAKAISNALSEGYRLGFEDCAKKFGIEIKENSV